MCLCLKMAKKEKKKYERIKQGWKVFHQDTGDNLFPEVTGNLSAPFPENTWVDEKDYREDKEKEALQYGYSRPPKVEKYPTGFHIYLILPNSKLLFATSCIRSVEFRKTVAYGWQNQLDGLDWIRKVPVVVAREIRILPLSEKGERSA